MKLDKIARQVRFLLCGSCFWCASALAGGVVEKCPACSGRLASARVSIRHLYATLVNASYEIDRLSN